MYKCKGCGREYEQPPNYNKCDGCGCEVSYVDTEHRPVREHRPILGKTADESDINSERPLLKSSQDERNDGEVEVTTKSPEGLELDRKGKSPEPHQSIHCDVLTQTKDGWLMLELTDELLEEMIKQDVPEGTQPPLYLKITPLCIKQFLGWKDAKTIEEVR